MLLPLQQLNLLAGASGSKTYSATFTRLALHGGARPLYGSFAGKEEAAASAVVNLSALTEVEIANGYKELFITLTDAVWDTGADFNSARQSIINGITSSGTEIKGWNNEVRGKIELPAVTRISDKTVRVELPASPAFDISSNETVTITIPAGATDAAVAIVATPTITVSAVALEGTSVTNSDAVAVPSNYEQCDKSGFRVLPGGLVRDGQTGNYVRPKSRDQRHPQEYLKAVPSVSRGSVSPEQDDNFLANGDVSASDL